MKLTVDDDKNMLEKLSETFANKSVGDMWSMGFLTTTHVTDILDLLNSQKAEIENQNVEIDILIRKKEALRDEISELTAKIAEKDTQIKKLENIERIADKTIATLNAENEKWQYKISELQHGILNCKSEAIRGFVERLENSEYGHYDWGNKDFVYTESDIDNLVKEMVGDAK